MVKFEEHMNEIERCREELVRATPGTPHYRDTRKHLHRLQAQYQSAKRYANDRKRVSQAD